MMTHRARDPVDLADPLLVPIGRAKWLAKPAAPEEQTLAQTALKLRLVDADKR